MKKIISLILVAVLALCSVFALGSCGGNEEDNLAAAYEKAYNAIGYAPADDAESLVVAMSPDFAPMEFYDTAKNEIVGFDVLLATYIANELGMKLVLDPMSFDASMAAVASGNADLAISGFSWTAERAETFLISDYYVAGENETEQILITTAAKKDQFTANKADFTGLKIGAQGGSLQELLVEEQLVTKGAEIELYININDAATALATGEIDALAVAYGNGEALANDNIVLSDYYFEVDEKYKNNVILLNKNDAELLEAVNAALAKAMAADLYDTWYEACQVYAEVKTLDELGYDDEGNKITE
ncbi:MAG: amino acid ABC transporter substrate-binding protein [Clostridia bacterium]|nr:amino acid ABC transporter substrate-binding protein [Clostridia bacterium]